MRIPGWRLALTGGSIVVLGALGIGIVAAAQGTTTAPAAPPAVAPSPSGAAAGAPAIRERIRAGLARPFLKPVAKHLVHATITATDREGNLVTFQLDHGTIAAIGSGSLTIAEAGGSRVTVSTDDSTVVFLGRGIGKGTAEDIEVGDEVFVQSRIDGATTLAKHVLIVGSPAEG